jgi:hypothetical protein
MARQLRQIWLSRSLPLKAGVIGALVLVLTYLAAALFFFAQLHSFVALLFWSIFLVGLLILNPDELVTDGSPENLWVPILGMALAWLTYSAFAYFWLKRRRIRLE